MLTPGVAVPEIISVIAATSWIVQSSVQIYKKEPKHTM